jgi:Putative amidase domain
MDWRGFVQKYFDAVHWSWMDGKYDRLAAFFTGEKQEKAGEWDRLSREFNQTINRGAIIYAVSGRVVPLYWMEVGDKLEVRFSWKGWRHYRIEEKRHVEASHRLITIFLSRDEDSWTITDTQEWDGDVKAEKEWTDQEEEPITVVGKKETKPLLVLHGASGYNANKAVEYAHRYWNSPNPAYPHFTDDCTNFISQCLHAGELPMLFSKEQSKGWWIRTGKGSYWSYSWTVAHSLYLLLKSGREPMRAIRKNTPQELVPGDVICYDFNGDGRYNHNTIVVAKDASNMPLVNAHTTDSSMRYWSYEDSTAYTPQIRYAFFHIQGLKV